MNNEQPVYADFRALTLAQLTTRVVDGDTDHEEVLKRVLPADYTGRVPVAAFGSSI